MTYQLNGFRKSLSTIGALTSLVDEPLGNMDKGELTILVFLNFKKTFDTIDHEILMQKVARAGLGENFLINYFKNRMQCTKLSNTESTTHMVKTGVL